MHDQKRKLPRALLIAAALALCTAGAAAAVWSLREAARADIGLEQLLPEWREYEETPAEADPAAVTLDSALCSGDQLDAYLRVSGVEPEAGASLEAQDGAYQWDIGSLDYRGRCTLGVEHVAYEADSRTALVRLHVEGIADAEQIAFGLTLRRGLEAVCQYAPVEIPVTPSGALSAETDVLLPRGEYRGDMRAVGVQVHASYVEVEFEYTPFRTVAAPEELADTEDIRYPDGRVENPARDALAEYLDSLSVRAGAALADATLHYDDGSSETVAAMPTRYAGSWVHDLEGTVEELRDQDRVAFRHVTAQAIDLSQVVSVTIGGINYALH